MTQIYSCGHKATINEDDEYTNGSLATWQEWYVDIDGDQLAECYGSLCNDCIVVRKAKRCRLGGLPL